MFGAKSRVVPPIIPPTTKLATDQETVLIDPFVCRLNANEFQGEPEYPTGFQAPKKEVLPLTISRENPVLDI